MTPKEREDSIAGVAFIVAMELGGNPEATANYALRIANHDPKSLNSLKLYQSWAVIQSAIFPNKIAPSGFRLYEEMDYIHKRLRDCLAKKGLLLHPIN